MTSEKNIDGRQPQKKMEDDLNKSGRRPKKMEDDQKKWKTT